MSYQVPRKKQKKPYKQNGPKVIMVRGKPVKMVDFPIRFGKGPSSVVHIHMKRRTALLIAGMCTIFIFSWIAWQIWLWTVRIPSITGH